MQRELSRLAVAEDTPEHILRLTEIARGDELAEQRPYEVPTRRLRGAVLPADHPFRVEDHCGNWQVLDCRRDVSAEVIELTAQVVRFGLRHCRV